MQNLIPALIKAKSEMPPIVKDGVNPFHKSRYATLDAIVSAITPSLSANGLVLIQVTQSEGETFRLVTQLWHTSGEHIEGAYPLPSPEDCSGEKNPSQAMGSALTYARRYSIASLLNLCTEDDDDGNAHGNGKAKPQPTPVTAVDWAKFTKDGKVTPPASTANLTEEEKFVLGYCDAQGGVESRGSSVSYKNGYTAGIPMRHL